jgi:uncharacterized DUF497 family protein
LGIEYDENKNQENQRIRGISFDLILNFDFEGARVVEDRRKEYGERRYQAIGLIAQRLHVVVFTLRGANIRVISLRKANSREVAVYEKYKAKA